MRTGILFFALGIYILQLQAKLPSPLLFYLACVSIVLFLFCHSFLSHRLIRFFLMASLSMFLGFGYAAWRADQRLADFPYPQDFGRWENQTLTLIGRVETFPTETQQQGVRFIFHNEKKFPFSVPKQISLSGLEKKQDQIHVGDCIQVRAKLTRPYGLANPYTFDLEQWAYEQNIHAFGKIKHLKESTDCETKNFFIHYGLESLRETWRDRYAEQLKLHPTKGVLIALAIGDQREITAKEWEIFYKTGITHLISISGLHVTMIASFFAMGAMFCWRLFPKCVLFSPTQEVGALVGFIAALCYSLIAGFSVPTQRTMLMLMTIALAVKARLSLSSFDILSYALLFVLLLDPMAVLSIGFWLSFGAVGALMFAGLYRTKRPAFFKENIKSQWVATIALIPLILLLFQQISLVSPLANAVAIPVVSLIVTPFTLIGLLPYCEIFLWMASHVFSLLMDYLTWLSQMPFAILEQHAPSNFLTVLAFLGIGFLFLPTGFPGKYFGPFLILPLFFTTPARPQLGEVHVHILDVGNGFAVWVQTAQATLLFDTGPKYSERADMGEQVVTPTLRAAGIHTIDMLVVSHEDTDHSGGLAAILRHFQVDHFRSSMPPTHPLRTHTHIKKQDQCQAGQHWEWDQVKFQILHPQKRDYITQELADNNMSCVLKIQTKTQQFLLAGDIEIPIEQRLTETLDPRQLQATVLLAPHHGSKTSSTQGFLSAVRPQIGIFSVGYRNQYGHPHPTIVKRYQLMGITTYRTDLLGQMRFILDAQQTKPKIWFYRPTHQRYWQFPAFTTSPPYEKIKNTARK